MSKINDQQDDNYEYSNQNQYEQQNTDGQNDCELSSEHPSPVLIAMSQLNQLQDFSQYQDDYVKYDYYIDDDYDLEMQCGKLNSQYSKNERKEFEIILDQCLGYQNSDRTHQIYIKSLQIKRQNQVNIESIYSYYSVSKIGYIRLFDIKDQLQSQMKYNFPDYSNQQIKNTQLNPFQKDFFNDNILNPILSLNKKIPARVIEKSKPMLCCQNLSRSIRNDGFLCIGLIIISICLMILNLLLHKESNQIQISIQLLFTTIFSFLIIVSYYLFIQSLHLFNIHSLFNWVYFFFGVSTQYLLIFIACFSIHNTIGYMVTSLILSFVNYSIAFALKDACTKSIRLFVLIKALPDQELYKKFIFCF